jgi:hypothetical protein
LTEKNLQILVSPKNGELIMSRKKRNASLEALKARLAAQATMPEEGKLSQHVQKNKEKKIEYFETERLKVPSKPE